MDEHCQEPYFCTNQILRAYWMKILLTIIIACLSMTIQASEEEGNSAEKKEKQEKVSFKFSGYIKNDFFFDSRQVVAAREGQFLLWPLPRVPDAVGQDINAQANFNFLSIQSRLRVTISGPSVLGARLSGMIEGDFFAATNLHINHLRLRHAIVKLNWENTELLTGQYWNPFFVTDCFPGTISFNTGAPIQGVARNPQIRVTHKVGAFQLMAAALSQRDFASTGPIGVSSSYLRNSMVPDLHVQAQYRSKSLIVGTGLAYKSLVPRLTSEVDTEIYKVNEHISGISALGFMKYTSKYITIKLQARYGENNTDILANSGYAVQRTLNEETQERAYTPLTNTSIWTDIHTNGKKIQFGLFMGGLRNNGTKDRIDEEFNGNQIVYGFGHNIEMLCRISPRVMYTINHFQMGMEAELTFADYGHNHDMYWRPARVESVQNKRLLLSVCYNF